MMFFLSLIIMNQYIWKNLLFLSLINSQITKFKVINLRLKKFMIQIIQQKNYLGRKSTYKIILIKLLASSFVFE